MFMRMHKQWIPGSPLRCFKRLGARLTMMKPLPSYIVGGEIFFCNFYLSHVIKVPTYLNSHKFVH